MDLQIKNKVMAKPILVINYSIENLNREQTIENLHSVKKIIQGSGVNEDYYSFVLPTLGESKVEVFYDKDINKIEHEKLVHKIEERLNDLEK